MRPCLPAIITLSLLLGAASAPAQDAGYLKPYAFKQWVGFFAKHQADTERCEGQPQPAMRDEIFGYIDALYAEQAGEFKTQYERTYNGARSAQGVRGGGPRCNQRNFQRSRAVYDDRLAQLASFDPAPKSQAEANYKLSNNIPSDAPACIASPPGLKPKPERAISDLVLSSGGSWKAPLGASVSGAGTLQLAADADGTVYGWLVVEASSNGFKQYGDTTAAVVVANSAGERIWNPVGPLGLSAYENQLAMSASGEFDRRRFSRPMMYAPDCDAAYAFLKVRFCGMQEDMDRYNQADSCPGQYGGPERGGRMLQNMIVNDVDAILDHVKATTYAIGDRFEVGAWQGIRIR